MRTRFSSALDPNSILPEYPRPQMVRSSYLNLNGTWQYAITDTDAPPACFDGDILVPFSPESELSGVNKTLTPQSTLWYEKRFFLPDGFMKERTLLHFGAVDQYAEVWLNGVRLGEHTGGYLPFRFEVASSVIQGENVLRLRVKDKTDTSYHARGKQCSHPGGIWYTPQSGIWQTVWLESVPQDYVQGLRITPIYEEAAVEIVILAENILPCMVELDGASRQGMTNQPIRIDVPGFIPWSPENPHLYAFSVQLGDDRVDSYFAMRKFSVEKDPQGIKRLFLNGRPYFHNGVLDQGYWPDGLLTPPTDEAMIFDITLMKQLGFNMLRKHIKIEPLRWYYHCDRLGMLVWQDMVNGGGIYNGAHIGSPLIFGNSHRDSDYAYFSREDAQGREEYLRERDETVKHLYNCPCIAMWVPFNEGWGQFDAVKTMEAIRAMDPTRTIDHASGWHDQHAGDFKSLHVYFKPFRMPHDRLKRAVILTEFGGYAYRAPDHCFSDKTFGYKTLKTPEALMKAYRKLYEKEILPAKTKGLTAAVYTQLSDVEMETNGFVTYDREVVKFPVAELRALNARLNDAEEEKE